jgi:hypothetical protein
VNRRRAAATAREKARVAAYVSRFARNCGDNAAAAQLSREARNWRMVARARIGRTR